MSETHSMSGPLTDAERLTGGRGTAAGRPAVQAGDKAPRSDAGCAAGAHDQPQSMCPAFGSLRVGLRMRAQHDGIRLMLSLIHI